MAFLAVRSLGRPTKALSEASRGTEKLDCLLEDFLKTVLNDLVRTRLSVFRETYLNAGVNVRDEGRNIG
jgi:hypothetical protein